MVPFRAISCYDFNNEIMQNNEMHWFYLWQDDKWFRVISYIDFNTNIMQNNIYIDLSDDTMKNHLA
jgi:hypothetical protein